MCILSKYRSWLLVGILIMAFVFGLTPLVSAVPSGPDASPTEGGGGPAPVFAYSCNAYADGNSRIRGDVSGDGRLDNVDGAILQSMVLGRISPALNACCTDIDQDGQLTIADANMAIDIFLDNLTSAGTCANPLTPGPIPTPSAYSCNNYSNGSSRIRGDVSGDGQLDNVDGIIIKSMVEGAITPILNACCTDIDQNGTLSLADANLVFEMFLDNYTTAGTCAAPLMPRPVSTPSAYSCNNYSNGNSRIRGDVTGDNRVDNVDTAVIQSMVTGGISPVLNACCTDIDQDGQLTIQDTNLTTQIFLNNYTTAGTCAAPVQPRPVSTIPSYSCDNYANGNSRLIGDITGNGKLDNVDSATISGMIGGALPFPSNRCCIDVDQDSNTTLVDVALVAHIFLKNYSSAGTCASPTLPKPITPNPSYFYCSSASVRGDVTVDGQVTSADVNILQHMVRGIVQKPVNQCCIDVDSNGSFSENDASIAARIADGSFTTAGTCSNPQTASEVFTPSTSGGGGGGGGGTLSSSISAQDSTIELGQTVVFDILCRTSSGCRVEVEGRSIGEVSNSSQTQTLNWRPAEVNRYTVDLVRQSTGFVLDSETVRVLEAVVAPTTPSDNNVPTTPTVPTTPGDTNGSIDTNGLGPTGFFGLGNFPFSASSVISGIVALLLFIGVVYFLTVKPEPA